MNEDKKNLPDREIADRNSVYKLAGQDDSSMQDMPDRVANERNSVYKLAEEAKQKYGTPDVPDEVNDTTIRGDKERDNADHANMGNPANPETNSTAGRTQYGEDRGGATHDNQFSTQSGGQSGNASQQFAAANNTGRNNQPLNDQENANSQTSRMGSTDTMGGQRGNSGQAGTNSLLETVKLDNDTLDGPSKLDAATDPNTPMPSTTRYSAPVRPNPTRDRDVDMNVERDIPTQAADLNNMGGMYTEPKRRTDDASQSYSNDRPRLLDFETPEDNENDRDNGIRTQQ